MNAHQAIGQAGREFGGGEPPRIYILHENREWVAPLRQALEARGLPFEEWFLDGGRFDLSTPPPEGVFFNRMSASSHTRGHRYAAELTGAILAWLEGHGRRVVNGGGALRLELSKAAQYAALRAGGIQGPETLVATTPADVAAVARARFPDRPFVLKPNRGGKGLGVRKFDDPGTLDAYLDSSEYEEPIDGLHLVQEFIEVAEPIITRMEFIGGGLYYAVRVRTNGSFELCPAEACAAGEPRDPGMSYCPAGDEASEDRFKIIQGFEHPLVPPVERFLAANEISVAGVEFMVDRGGTAFVHDINTNTNYNPDAEKRSAGFSGLGQIAGYLGRALEGEYRDQAAD